MATRGAAAADEATMRKSIGARLRTLREESGLFLKDVSDQAGISYGYLSEIERGLKMPPLPTLYTVCDIYGVLVADFLADLYPFGTLKPPTS